MSRATEVLRRLLDESGVKWTYGDGTVSFSDGKHWCHAWAYNDDTMCVSMGYFTPEQAVAATLGSGECEIETTENWLPAERYHRCKHCGAFFAVMNASGDIQPCVCPNCGKAVKR